MGRLLHQTLNFVMCTLEGSVLFWHCALEDSCMNLTGGSVEQTVLLSIFSCETVYEALHTCPLCQAPLQVTEVLGLCND